MKIGFLPLYVKLYDDVTPESRPRHEAFYAEITKLFEERGVAVVTSPFCRLANEFEEAIKKFEAERVDTVVSHDVAPVVSEHIKAPVGAD